MFAARNALAAGGPTKTPSFVSVGAQYETSPWPGGGGYGYVTNLSYNVPAASNNVLFTAAFIQGGTQVMPTATFNGVAMTAITYSLVGGQFWGVFMLRNPAATTGTLSITASSSTNASFWTIDTASILYKDVGVVGTPTTYAYTSAGGNAFPDTTVPPPYVTVPPLGLVMIVGLGQYCYSMLGGIAVMRQGSLGSYPAVNIAEVATSGTPSWNSIQRPYGLYAMIPLNPS